MRKHGVVVVLFVGIVIGCIVGYLAASSRGQAPKGTDKVGMTQFQIRDIQGFPNVGTITHVPWQKFLPDSKIYGDEFKPRCEKIVVDKYSKEGWNQYLLYEEDDNGNKKEVLGILTLQK